MSKDKKPYRILVVEDNPGDLLIITEFLKEQIYHPVIKNVINFKEAEQFLNEDTTGFDVILLDLILPDKSGQELINNLLSVAKNCPVIILTGYADIDFSIASISQGVLDYLLKDDLNPTILYKSIIYAIERKKTVSALKKSEKQYADLFNLSPQPMWVYDPETSRFMQVNEAAIAHYGYSEQEFLNMTIMDINHTTEMPIVMEVVSKGFENINTKGKFLHSKKNNELIEVEIYSTPITINDKAFRSVIAIDVTQRVRYEHKITKAIIKTQEDERYEIGAELHDNVCQILATSHITLGMLKDSLDERKIPIYNLCKENISLALDEIRNLSHQLAPAFFDDTTLEEAFSRLLNNFNINEKYEIKLQIEKTVAIASLPREVQINLYRILQEQLNNISKHAFAKTIFTDVSIIDKKLMMKIKDDGIGFDIEKLKPGIGFANMIRRCELFAGSFNIKTSPDKGCVVEIEFPLS